MADTDLGKEGRTPEEIERELEQTRSEISRTIEAIQYKITPGQLANDAYGYLRDNSGDFAKNLGTAAKNNPVPVALIGLGLAWLMMGGGTPAYLQGSRTRANSAPGSESGTSFGGVVGAAGSYARSAGGYARNAGSSAGHALSSAGHAISSAGQAISDAVSRAGSSLLGLGHRTGEAVSGLGHSVGSSASGASERVRRMSEDVRNLASEWSGEAGDLAESARDQIYRASEVVQEQAMQMRDNTSQMLRDQPLVAGALGIAIGAVIGALLPLSRRENELMGETRDQLLDQAMEYGQQTYEQATEAAKNVANAAAEAAKSEAEKQGLTGSGQSDTGAYKPQGTAGHPAGSGEKWSGSSPGQYSSGSRTS